MATKSPIVLKTPGLSWWQQADDLPQWYPNNSFLGIWPDVVAPYDRWSDGLIGPPGTGCKVVYNSQNGLPGVFIDQTNLGSNHLECFCFSPGTGAAGQGYSFVGPGSFSDGPGSFSSMVTWDDDQFPNSPRLSQVATNDSDSPFTIFCVMKFKFTANIQDDFNNGLIFGGGGTSNFGISLARNPDGSGHICPWQGPNGVFAWVIMSDPNGPNTSYGHLFENIQEDTPYIFEARYLNSKLAMRMNGVFGSWTFTGPGTSYVPGPFGAVYTPGKFINVHRNYELNDHLEIGDWGGFDTLHTWYEDISFSRGLSESECKLIRCYLSHKWAIPIPGCAHKQNVTLIGAT